jgi:hypothetical protein
MYDGTPSLYHAVRRPVKKKAVPTLAWDEKNYEKSRKKAKSSKIS